MNVSLDFVAFLYFPFFLPLLRLSDDLEADAVSWTEGLLLSGCWDGCDQSSNAAGFIQALNTPRLVEKACWGRPEVEAPGFHWPRVDLYQE